MRADVYKEILAILLVSIVTIEVAEYILASQVISKLVVPPVELATLFRAINYKHCNILSLFDVTKT